MESGAGGRDDANSSTAGKIQKTATKNWCLTLSSETEDDLGS